MNRALVFPGQGSQKIGMGKELFDNFSSAKEVFEEVNDSLSRNLTNIIFNGPQAELTLTKNAQPAIMCVSMAIMKILKKDFNLDLNDHASYFAGHSLGEYTALAAANSLSLSDTAKILYFRGEKMQEASQKFKTAMAAFLGADIIKINEILMKSLSSNEVCNIANYNTQSQIVLSGDEVTIDKAIKLAGEINIRAVKLQVSAPFHSSYMKNAARALQEKLQKVSFNIPITQIVSNYKALPFENNIEDIIDSLIKQTYSTVKWYESIMFIKNNDINQFIEIGYGSTLNSIIKRIDKENLVQSIYKCPDIEKLAKEIS